MIKNEKELSEYLVKINEDVDKANIESLKRTIELIKKYPNDISKYSIPEALKTHLMMTINARSLMNFFSLRSSEKALKEMRILSKKIYESLPEEHKFIFSKFYNKSKIR
jgi:thymidylate synthase (FAD)